MKSKTKEYRLIKRQHEDGKIEYLVQWKSRNFIFQIFGWYTNVWGYETQQEATLKVQKWVDQDNIDEENYF